MKNLDLPPVWLLLFVIIAWAMARLLPTPQFFPEVFSWVGGALVLAGLLISLWAVTTMMRARTTPIPRRDPKTIVTSGPFAFSRNPIYLGDAMLLLGVVLWLQSWIALILVPIFIMLIERRYIIDEEKRLTSQFKQEFLAYCGKTRRWI